MYQVSKTVKKAGLPLILVVLVNIAIQIAESQGAGIDETTIWSVAMSGYAALLALINWLKNHKLGKI